LIARDCASECADCASECESESEDESESESESDESDESDESVCESWTLAEGAPAALPPLVSSPAFHPLLFHLDGDDDGLAAAVLAAVVVEAVVGGACAGDVEHAGDAVVGEGELAQEGHALLAVSASPSLLATRGTLLHTCVLRAVLKAWASSRKIHGTVHRSHLSDFFGFIVSIFERRSIVLESSCELYR